MFKKLHLTRKIVFEGDERALTECRKRMNDEFKKNKQVSNEDTVKEMIKFGNEVEQVLRTSVIQATTEDNETLSKYTITLMDYKIPENLSIKFFFFLIFRIEIKTGHIENR